MADKRIVPRRSYIFVWPIESRATVGRISRQAVPLPSRCDADTATISNCNAESILYWSTRVQCHLKSILILLNHPISPKVLRLLNLPTQMLFFVLLIILVLVCSLLSHHFLSPQTPRLNRLLKRPLKGSSVIE